MTHEYLGVGTYTVTVAATDKDGAASAATTVSVTVRPASLAPDEMDSSLQSLYVVGTAGNDNIVVRPSDATGGLEVLVNGRSQGVFRPTGRVYVDALAGNDAVALQSRRIGRATAFVTAEAVLKGGDALVGDAGKDTLRGGSGEDLLVGGSFTFVEGNLPTLLGVVAAWERTDRSYAERVADLLHGGVNSSDDHEADTLLGGAGDDWFLASLDQAFRDLVRDRTKAETLTGAA